MIKRGAGTGFGLAQDGFAFRPAVEHHAKFEGFEEQHDAIMITHVPLRTCASTKEGSVFCADITALKDDVLRAY